MGLEFEPEPKGRGPLVGALALTVLDLVDHELAARAEGRSGQPGRDHEGAVLAAGLLGRLRRVRHISNLRRDWRSARGPDPIYA